MADDAAPSPDDVVAAFQKFSPSGGTRMPRSNAAIQGADDQNAADAVAAATRQFSAPTTPPPQDEGFLNRAFRSILDLPKTVARDLTPTFQMPGSAGPQIAPGLAASPTQAAIPEPELFSGFHRGVRDTLDTGAEGLAWMANKIPGVNVDLDALGKSNTDDRSAWEEEHGDSGLASLGRVAGQTAATAPVIGGVGGLVARGAAAIPGAAGRAAQLIAGSTPAETRAGRAAQLATQGAATGATQAGSTASSSDQPIDQQLLTGTAFGGVTGPVIGGLTKAVDLLRGYAGGIQPEIARLADLARQKYGIDIPLTSLTSNPTLRLLMDQGAKLPFSGTYEGQLRAQRQVQGAIARVFGSDANTLGPATMDETAGRLSRGYNDLFANAPRVTGGEPLTNDLADVGADASRFLVGDAGVHVGNAMREVSNAFSGGSLDPQAYKSLMGANDGVLARIEDAAPSSAAPYLARIRQAVQDRFADSAGPDAAAKLADLDRQWRAMKTVEPLAAKSNTGDIQVGGLRQQAINASNRFDSSTGGMAYTGGGPYGDLGRIGQQFFGSLPDSGTAAREVGLKGWQAALAAIPSLAVNRPLQALLRRPVAAQRAIATSLGGFTPDIGRGIPYGLLGPIDYSRDRAPVGEYVIRPGDNQ